MCFQEIAGIFNTFDEIYLVFIGKKTYISAIYFVVPLVAPLRQNGGKLMLVVSLIKQEREKYCLFVLLLKPPH